MPFPESLGAKIYHIGSNTLKIDGVRSTARRRIHHRARLPGSDQPCWRGGCDPWIHPYRKAGVSGYDPPGDGTRGVIWEVMAKILSSRKISRCAIESDLGGMVPEISVMPWPAFPTDLMSIVSWWPPNPTGSCCSMTGCIPAACTSPINW